MQLEPIRVQNRSGFNAVGNPTADGTLNEKPSRYTLVQSSDIVFYSSFLLSEV